MNLLPPLFIDGAVAGWIDSIAGGGGLITLPVLLGLGLPPTDALGTNKLQAVFGSGAATWHYDPAGLIDFRESTAGVVFTALGLCSVRWRCNGCIPISCALSSHSC